MTFKQLFYDWGGGNEALFQLLNAGTPESLEPLIWAMGLGGNYWTAPLVVAGLWLWSKAPNTDHRADAVRDSLVRFCVGFCTASVVAILIKVLLDFPRPPAVFEGLVQVWGEPQFHYSLPSGHATYAALVVGTLWSLTGRHLRIALILYLVLVGWSRVAAGMHFPADVVVGWGVGLASYAASRRLIRAGSIVNKHMTRNFRWAGYGAAGLTGFLDQSTKASISHTFGYADQVPITTFFNLVYVLNPGAAFSFLAGAGGWQRYFFIALALSVSTFLALQLRKPLPRMESLGFGLILGGALGNALDRITRGSVVDFLDFHWSGMHWPAFNFADVWIFLGVSLLVVHSMLLQPPTDMSSSDSRSAT